MSELLRARGLRKTFVDGSGQSIEVLKGIDLRVGHGESLSIMGQSGSGKSTLLYILGGLDSPTEGAVFCGREDVHRRKPVEIADWRNSRLGFVFQTHHLMKDFNARENVAMPAFIASKTGKAEALERADRILRRLGLKHRLDQRVIHLSGGEQQRVSIARALVNGPQLILADEPTGNLDERSGAAVAELLVEACRQASAALVAVTHNERFAALMQRRFLLQNGRLQSMRA